MHLHQAIQKLLLTGVHIEAPAAVEDSPPPAEILPLIEAVAGTHRQFDDQAVFYGNRYRSGFWAIYLLSAIAVLCAVLPLAVGWDDLTHVLKPHSRTWSVLELCVILTVVAIYLSGNRGDWRGKWLGSRTSAELTSYLPLLAPLVNFNEDCSDASWYSRVFDPGENIESAPEVEQLCRRMDPTARQLLDGAWHRPAFVASYARWTLSVLENQKNYHHRVAVRQHALLHRVHGINNYLFGLTAIGATLHLFLHSLWLSLVTTFFPALASSLHGALAQSESFRLSVTSESLVVDLGAAIERIRALCTRDHADLDPAAVRNSIQDAVAIILEEHQEWHMLVRPHHLPLA